MTLNPKILAYARRSGRAAGQLYMELGVLLPNRLDRPNLQEYADAWRTAMLAEIAPALFAVPDPAVRTQDSDDRHR